MKRLPAFIPKGAKWYLADLVVAIAVGASRRRTVHVNTVLVRADSPAEAYTLAMRLGRESAARYRNSRGEPVRFRFLGLRRLEVIHDALKHGAELRWQELQSRTQVQAQALVSKKANLAVFKTRPALARGPDVVDGGLLLALKRVTRPSSRSRPRRIRVTRTQPAA